MDKYTRIMRTIVLKDDVCGDMVEVIAIGLNILSTMDNTKPIIVYINSWGGDLGDCGAIIDMIAGCRAPVYTVGLGAAYSAAAIILALGQKGRRAVTPHGSLMLHSVKAGSGEDLPKNIEGYAGFVKQEFRVLCREICKRSAFKYRDFMKSMDSGDEVWLPAKEARKKGIVDFIWTPSQARKILKQAEMPVEDQASVQEILAIMKRIEDAAR